MLLLTMWLALIAASYFGAVKLLNHLDLLDS